MAKFLKIIKTDINVFPSSCCASNAEIYVLPTPTTSDKNTPPYWSNFDFASKTASF